MAMSCRVDDPLPLIRLKGGDPASPPLPCSVVRIPLRISGTPHGAFPVVELSFLFPDLQSGLERDSNPRLSVSKTDALPN
jgi:hypothetical protein